MKSTPHGSKLVAGTASALATAISTVLGVWSPHALAFDPGVVTTCEDSSLTPLPGTLRYAAANVPDAGTIDLTTAPCGKIFLNWANGPIQLQQSSVTITGPDNGAFEIDGRWNQNCFSGGQPVICPPANRVFTHTGTGTLSIANLVVSNGISAVGGGCIFSAGSIWLGVVDVHACSVTAASGEAKGGAVYAANQLQIKYSTISDSTVNAGSGDARGGGAFAQDIKSYGSTISGNTASASATSFGGGLASTNLYMYRTTLSSNVASGSNPFPAFGGGAFASSVDMRASTISGNQTSGGYGKGGGIAGVESIVLRNSTVSANTTYRGGGIYTQSSQLSSTLTIINSTISGNTSYRAAGVFTRAGSVAVKNSTITQNRGQASFGAYASGLNIYLREAGHTLSLDSSIIAQNYLGTKEADLYESDWVAHPITITGSNNLIRAAKGNAPPPDTSKSCPWLGALRDNGGPTLTHALLSGSPAIDNGNNAATLDEDQRGSINVDPPYPYPRADNLATVADIGAYEMQPEDNVFNTSFEGCAAPSG